MALIHCPKCGASISEKATKCIKCGYALNMDISYPEVVVDEFDSNVVIVKEEPTSNYEANEEKAVGLGLGEIKWKENSSAQDNPVQNKLAYTLKLVGKIFLIAGAIIGCIGAFAYTEEITYSFSLLTFLLSWALFYLVFFFPGIIFMGFGEIIKLLQQLVDNSKREKE